MNDPQTLDQLKYIVNKILESILLILEGNKSENYEEL